MSSGACMCMWEALCTAAPLGLQEARARCGARQQGAVPDDRSLRQRRAAFRLPFSRSASRSASRWFQTGFLCLEPLAATLAQSVVCRVTPCAQVRVLGSRLLALQGFCLCFGAGPLLCCGPIHVGFRTGGLGASGFVSSGCSPAPASRAGARRALGVNEVRNSGPLEPRAPLFMG